MYKYLLFTSLNLLLLISYNLQLFRYKVQAVLTKCTLQPFVGKPKMI